MVSSSSSASSSAPIPLFLPRLRDKGKSRLLREKQTVGVINIVDLFLQLFNDLCPCAMPDLKTIGHNFRRPREPVPRPPASADQDTNTTDQDGQQSPEQQQQPQQQSPQQPQQPLPQPPENTTPSHSAHRRIPPFVNSPLSTLFTSVKLTVRQILCIPESSSPAL